ncbi:uncharacterized protein LOC113516805 [Galleria mellonella]|uniref:Uncharacterized protein LOC113516805 n=1 Tax=Galleria mellonella TaxID=7137 RepID=A0ABM3MJK1_GALME|nr:uncharacterized protein LOC113516805 [Galleria mellonella]
MTDDGSNFSVHSEQLETFYENKYVFRRNHARNKYTYDHSKYEIRIERSHYAQKDGSNRDDKISIVVLKNEQNRHEKHTKFKVDKNTADQMYHDIYFRKKYDNITMGYSTHELYKSFIQKVISERTHLIQQYLHYDIIRTVKSESKQTIGQNLFKNSLIKTNCKVYRCQLNTQKESCCCSCNSDAMFEVMKSLYDCYKKKNCDNCNCILCGHLPREERRLGELRKSGVPLTGAGKETANVKKKKKKHGRKTKEAAAEIAEKEKILADLVVTGAPLPEPKTASEKELVKKVKKKFGLSPKPKTLEEKERYKRAEVEGLITPLEGKNAKQKEKILKKQAELGIQLPEDRTHSEKVLTTKIKGMTAPSSVFVPSEKLRKAKAAGFITPLEGKTSEEKERILRGLAMQGVPLLEGKTESEKKLIAKVRADLGLPLEPKTATERNKYNNAIVAGIITPLEGKSSSQKERILIQQNEMGLPLPEGRTVSEKALIAKIKTTAKPPSMVMPSEKLRKAKAIGLITPLKGKSLEQKEKILKGLAMHDISLPEGKTSSEKKLIEKVRADVGLPPAPKSTIEKEKYKKALAAGFITPLEGKFESQKQKILKGQADLGLALPHGRTSSEKALIRRIKAATVVHGKQLLSPDQAKKLNKKTSKVMKEGKGPSDECICPFLTPELQRLANLSKNHQESGKITSEKNKTAKAEPLDGKTAVQKEKILKGLAIQGKLLEGKTASEKKLIAKVRHDVGLPPEPKSASKKAKLKSEKFHKSKDAGLLTPLRGKTSGQKEKILKGLVIQGITLPEGKTRSEKKLINKVRHDFGLPPQPETPSAKEKYNRAIISGLITPLEGKSATQKEKILRGQAELGLQLPDGRTPSEKALVNRVKATIRVPSAKSEKIRKVKAAGLLTPLEGKTFSEKIQAEDVGLLTPLEGKTSQQKENILRGLVKVGVPFPKGKTTSEKELIRKIRKEAGLPVKLIASEKRGKYAIKSKKTGAAVVTKSSKRAGEIKRSDGIKEEFQDVIKTTTCDRGCGCDKKKIRFKHSYVKIRVTSPDISSLCPCPDECVPGVKHGVFTDSKGIKVTVGRVIGVPSYSVVSNTIEYETSPVKIRDNFKTIFINKHACKFEKGDDTDENLENSFINDFTNTNSLHINYDDKNVSTDTINNSEENVIGNFGSKYEKCNKLYSYLLSGDSSNKLSRMKSEDHINNSDNFDNDFSCSTAEYLDSSRNKLIRLSLSVYSLESTGIIKCESSLSLFTNSISGNVRTVSVISFADSNLSPDDSLYLLSEPLEDETFTNTEKESEYYSSNDEKEFSKSNADADSLHVMSDLNNEQGIINVVEKVLDENAFSNLSSLLLLVSSSDCDSDYSLSIDNSTTCMQISKNISPWNKLFEQEARKANQRTTGLKISARGMRYLLKNVPPKADDVNIMRYLQKCADAEEKEHVGETCQSVEDSRLRQQAIRYVVGTDTTQDRLCSCPPKKPISLETEDKYTSSVASEVIIPIIKSQYISQGLKREAYVDESSVHKKIKMVSYPSPFCVNNSNQTVSVCSIPPCRGQNSCHQSSLNVTHPSHEYGIKYKRFHTKNKKFIGNVPKNMTSDSCGGSKPCLRRNSPVNPHLKPMDNKCTKCAHPKITERRAVGCQCSGVEKKVKLKPLCPCEIYESPLSAKPTDVAEVEDRKKGCSCLSDQKSKRKHNKKVVCKCPQQEDLFLQNLEEYTNFEWIDIKEVIKMKSDIAQTTSGFKFDVKPRQPPEVQMSFEEALQYYAEHPTEDLIEKDDWSYADKPLNSMSNTDVICECPYELPSEVDETRNKSQQLRKGLKFHITGKGSASKGLSSVCCFDMVEETTGFLLSPSRSV